MDITPIEAIDQFYKWKNEYETSYYEFYVKPIVLGIGTKREKRILFSKLPLPNCINCKRNVKTIFSVVPNLEEGIKIYKIACGDIQNPCPLNIEIHYFMREPMDKTIRDGLKQIEQIKLNIIKEKNNAIFFNSSGVIDTFNGLTQQLKTTTENTGFIIETNILRNYNPAKYELLSTKMDEFGKNGIIPFKKMMQDFEETNRQGIMDEALSFYNNEMRPSLDEILKLKYNINVVEYEQKNNQYHLIQLPVSLENNEFFLNDSDKVVRFIQGVKQTKTSTKKNKENTKNTTKRRRKPVGNIVLVEAEEETKIPDETKEPETKGPDETETKEHDETE